MTGHYEQRMHPCSTCTWQSGDVCLCCGTVHNPLPKVDPLTWDRAFELHTVSGPPKVTRAPDGAQEHLRLAGDLEWRKTWLLGIARATGEAADCTRRKVGALLVRPDTWHVLALGYNGRPAGLPGCLTENGCPRGALSYAQVAAGASYLTGGAGACDAWHAEDNALRRAREGGIDVTGAWAVITDEPCDGCYALLRHYGIALAVWPTGERTLG